MTLTQAYMMLGVSNYLRRMNVADKAGGEIGFVDACVDLCNAMGMDSITAPDEGYAECFDYAVSEPLGEYIAQLIYENDELGAWTTLVTKALVERNRLVDAIS